MSLVVAYSFDEGSGSSIIDRSGNGHDQPLASISGGPTWNASGHTNGGLSDNGSTKNGSYGIPYATPGWQDWAPIGGPCTAMAWVKLDDTTVASIIWCFGVNGGYSGSFDCYFLTDVGMGFYMTAPPSNGTVSIQTNPTSLWTPDTSWHHWAMVCDGSTLKVYLDGILLGSTSAGGFPTFADHDNFGMLHAYPTFDSIQAKARIDDFRCYAAALSASDIATCMSVAVGTAADPLTAGIDLVVQDAAQAETVDNVVLVQNYNLVVQDAAQAETVDNVVLTQESTLVVADAAQAETVDNVVLTQVHILAVNDAHQNQTVSNVSLGNLTTLDIDRLALQDTLEQILGTGNVYFQPPTNVQLVYPCIIYKRDYARTLFADNLPHRFVKRYMVTVIDRDPDSAIVEKIAALPMCTYNRFYTADALNHDVFTLFY